MYCTYSCMCNTGTTAVLLIAHTYCGYSTPLEEVIPDACAAKAAKAKPPRLVANLTLVETLV